ncbi:hypothetical protein [Kribbella catacumbae]|uniref:hypothetical protein n=1 Tax=Kribbella catacumbae TaxID=460086 RepID=UPI00037B804B|nr:hypothetical protein [Kribbella catacumbae]
MNTSRRIGRSRLARWTGRSRLIRSLVILGALLGVFALHSLSADHDPLPAPASVVSSASLTQAFPLYVDPHKVIERLEQATMLAPSVLAPGTTDHRHQLLPCLAFLSGSLLLLLSAWAGLRRQRFGDQPQTTARPTSRRLHRSAMAAPQLAQLCVLRT